MKIVSLFGGSTRNKSLAVTAQRRLNCYYENRPDQDKSKVVIFGTPGLVTQYTIGTKPIRAMVGTVTALYVVAYNQFYVLNPLTGAILFQGTIQTYFGAVQIAASPTQVLIVDGITGYCYTIASLTLAVVSPWQASGALTICFCSGFFVAEQPKTQTFWVSNAFDGSTWNALSFAAASGNSDTILAVDQLNSNLICFMTQSMQFFVNEGSFPEPFIDLPSAANTFGLASYRSRVHCDGGILFLAMSTQGVVQAARLDGYNVTVISDADMESIWNGFPTIADAVALSYQRDKHIFYQITFPTANRSFLYDCSTHLWNEVQTGTSITPVRHTANLATYAAGTCLLSDYQNGNIYKMSDSAYTDNGVPIIREVITRHIFSNFNKIRISAIYLDMETGVGLTSGQGSNPQVMMQYSRDNGRTWSPERWASLGQIGQYLTRVIWRRLACARDYVFKFRMSDPVKFVITQGAIKMNERQPAELSG